MSKPLIIRVSPEDYANIVGALRGFSFYVASQTDERGKEIAKQLDTLADDVVKQLGRQHL